MLASMTLFVTCRNCLCSSASGKRRFQAIRGLLSFIGCLALAACSTSHYRHSADNETAKAIAQKSAAVPNMDPHFTIEQTNILSLNGLPVATHLPVFLGAEGAVELGAPIVSLEKALEVAVNHSRLYQSRKERVYLEALDLTLARHQFTPLFSARASGEYEVYSLGPTGKASVAAGSAPTFRGS